MELVSQALCIKCRLHCSHNLLSAMYEWQNFSISAACCSLIRAAVSMKYDRDSKNEIEYICRRFVPFRIAGKARANNRAGIAPGRESLFSFLCRSYFPICIIAWILLQEDSVQKRSGKKGSWDSLRLYVA